MLRDPTLYLLAYLLEFAREAREILAGIMMELIVGRFGVLAMRHPRRPAAARSVNFFVVRVLRGNSKFVERGWLRLFGPSSIIDVSRAKRAKLFR